MNANDLIEFENNSNGKLQENFIKKKKLPLNTDVLILDEFWEYVEDEMSI